MESEWISVKDKKPTKGKVLVYVPPLKDGRNSLPASIHVQDGVVYGFRRATHWMPLPEPPQ